MAFRRLCICDVCSKKEEAYAPKGWRIKTDNIRDLNGKEIATYSALCCSDRCERTWLFRVAKDRLKDLR